ncbi:DUF4321 domain-containing protein [Clostridium cylindrosporum]|uniref:DUF4321 domain-containing protein n=1 Tax=Clostridium cylindrosporum DSM 605 TaxID=1121307 RepID=A0A0J8DB60_CLOCY|nr:DUF4321 domain-containing protein [Clostridium cylindrosporum]KMT21534.1 hypothetical protein CLCY_2c02960 [Clostridium cylindrosporum DSM 605]
MSVRSGKGYIYLFTLIIIFGLAGGALGDALGQNFQFLEFLGTGYTLGMTKPFEVNLGLLSFTFGINFTFNILSIGGMILGYTLYRKMW